MHTSMCMEYISTSLKATRILAIMGFKLQLDLMENLMWNHDNGIDVHSFLDIVVKNEFAFSSIVITNWITISYLV